MRGGFPNLGVFALVFLGIHTLYGQDLGQLEPVPVIDEGIILEDVGFYTLRTGVLPGEVGVIVNTQDPQSVAVADYYMDKRGIPAENRIEVAFSLIQDSIPYEDFVPIRRDILERTPAHIQVYAITWTQPWLVGGSCMSMTAAVSLGSASLIDCERGHFSAYYEASTTRPFDDLEFRPSMMLAGRDKLDVNGSLIKSGVDWVKELIDRSVGADRTFPQGKGYFVRTVDPLRSLRWEDQQRTVEEWDRPEALDLEFLDQSGNNTFNFSDHDDVLFYFSGRQVDAGISSNTYLPGSVADNVTSFNGVLVPEILPEGTEPTLSSHTSILRFFDGTKGGGVSASYGPVVEPTAQEIRFSRASVFIPAYFGGATVVEAYWKSVEDPYFGNFIGDPLTRPYGVNVRVDDQNNLLMKTSILKPNQPHMIAVKGRDGSATYEILVDDLEVERPGIVEISLPFRADSDYLMIPNLLIQRVGLTPFPTATMPAITVVEGEAIELGIVAQDPLGREGVLLDIQLANGNSLESINAIFTGGDSGEGVLQWTAPDVDLTDGNSVTFELTLTASSVSGDLNQTLTIPLKALRKKEFSRVLSPDFSRPIESTEDFKDLSIEVSPGDAEAIIALVSASFSGGADILVDIFYSSNAGDSEGPYHFDSIVLRDLPTDKTLYLMLYSVIETLDGSLDFSLIEHTFEIKKVDPDENMSPTAFAEIEGGNMIEWGQNARFRGVDSSDPEASILSFFWEFGDGRTSNQMNPTHLYLAPGEYTAILTVSDGLKTSLPSVLEIVVEQTDRDIGEIGDGDILSGGIEPLNDIDVGVFNLLLGQTVELRVKALECCDLHPMIQVFDSDGIQMGQAEAESVEATLNFHAHSDGTYMVLIRDRLDASGPYEVELKTSPAPPGGIQATSGTLQDRIRVEWSASEGAGRYHLFRSRFDEKESALPIALDLAELFYEDLDVLNGVRYRYWVAAEKTGLLSALLSPASGYALDPQNTDESLLDFELGLIGDAAVSPGGAYFATSGGSQVTLWNASDGLKIREFPDETEISAVAISPNGSALLTGNLDGGMKLWDLDNGSLIQVFEGHTDRVYDLAFSPNGTRILSGSRDGTLKLWDGSSGSLLLNLTVPGGEVRSVDYAPDGSRLLSGGGQVVGGHAQLWDESNGHLLRTFEGHEDTVLAVAFSPDGKAILTGSEDQTARLWNIEDGQVIRQFEIHEGSIEDVQFSPDGRKFLTASGDTTARLWSTEKGTLVRTYTGHTSAVGRVAFTLNGERLLTFGYDGFSQLWAHSESPPFISTIADQIIQEDENLTIDFVVGDEITPSEALLVSVQASSDDLVAEENFMLSGTGGQRSLTVMPRPDRHGVLTVEIQVLAPTGLVAVEAFQLTIEPVNDPPEIEAVGDQVVFDGDTVQVDVVVNDLETLVEDLILTVSSDHTDLVSLSHWTPEGEAQRYVLSIQVNEGHCGIAGITVSVEDEGGSIASTQFKVVKPCEEDLEIHFGEAFGVAGGEVGLLVVAKNFNGLKRVRFPMEWDSTLAEFVGIELADLPGLTLDAFDLSRVDDGDLGLDWTSDETSSEGQTLDEGTVLFSVRFQLLGPLGSETSVHVGGDPGLIEVVNELNEEGQAFFKPGKLRVVDAISLSGSVRYFEIEGEHDFTGVEVTLEGNDDIRIRPVDELGGFQFDEVAAGGNYSLSVRKATDQPVQRQVTTLDILLVKAHILHVIKLESPLRQLAADVNRDGRVTTLDVLFIRRLILGSEDFYTMTEGQKDDLWLGVPSDLVFSDPEDPWVNLRQSRVYDVLSGDKVDQDFILLKLGDANGQ